MPGKRQERPTTKEAADTMLAVASEPLHAAEIAPPVLEAETRLAVRVAPGTYARRETN